MGTGTDLSHILHFKRKFAGLIKTCTNAIYLVTFSYTLLFRLVCLYLGILFSITLIHGLFLKIVCSRVW